MNKRSDASRLLGLCITKIKIALTWSFYPYNIPFVSNYSNLAKCEYFGSS